jgi:hypothetical protein
MLIVGCDFHPSWQQIAWFDTETGETGERKLVHAAGEAKQFYQQLPAAVLIGMEATGNSQWFIELVEDLGQEIWIGDAAQIRASYVRQQKTDKRDAAHILKLMREGRFPRLWAPNREQRDLRQLVMHRRKLVEIRSRVKNELQHLSLNKGMQRKRTLWSQAGLQRLRELRLKPWAGRRREDLLGLLSMLDEQVSQLDQSVQQAAEENPQARLLMTQPGVGSEHGTGVRGGWATITRKYNPPLSLNVGHKQTVGAPLLAVFEKWPRDERNLLHPQLPEQKRINVHPFFNLFCNRFSRTMSRLGLDPQQDRTLTAAPIRRLRLHQRGHLFRVHGIDAGIGIRGHEHDCGILRPRLHVLIR